jgi:glycosyltransferase involved in cell wall biosynthesis
MRACVLALSLSKSTGGPAKSVAAFQRALGAEVISWIGGRGDRAEPQIWEHCTVVRGSTLPLLSSLGYPQRAGLADAERIVAASRVVSCHSFWRWHTIWLDAVARRHGVPYWFVPHGGLDPYVFEEGRLEKRAFLSLGGRKFLDHAAAVVCATDREYRKLEPLMPHARRAVIPWPLDDADFRTRDQSLRVRVRRELGIPEDAVAALSFGRLHPMKRPLETIDAFAAGAAGGAHLVIVGNESGVSLGDCRDRARRASIADRVHVVGPAFGGAKYAYFDACDVYVSLSHRENFNYTAAESLASGLPVLLSPGNDLAPDLAPHDCGWMLPALDDAPAALAAATTADPAALAAMGRRGRAWADANLRFDAFRSRVVELAGAIGRRA